MSLRILGITAIAGFTLLSSIAASATPATANSWGWGESNHRYEQDGYRHDHDSWHDRDGYRYDHDGWYDRDGHYHRYDRDGSRHSS